MTAWRDLEAELDAWRAAGRTVTLWWRDDDAVAATPELDRLLALAADHGVPLALAVIPRAAEPSLARAVAEAPHTAVLVHGLAHENHAAAGEKKCEFPLSRRGTDTLAALRRGRTDLAARFGVAALPVFVPPWNRLADGWLADLAACGYAGLSRFGPRPAAATGPLCQVNTHVDPIAWRAGGGFVGRDTALAALTGHLRDRRTGACDPDEPTGLLTHHLVQDAATWDFVADLFARTAARAGVTWLPGPALFDHTGRDGA